MKLAIHMGLHKTASTSFQMVLDKNRNFLCKAEILYPEVFDKAIYGLEDNPSRVESKHFAETIRRFFLN